MKTIYKLFSLLAATAFMASCSNELGGNNSDGQGETVLELDATIENEVGSRAGINATSFDAGDSIGVTLWTSTYEYINVRADYSGGNWTLAKKIPLGENSSQICAYYPYTKNVPTGTTLLWLDASKQYNYLYGIAEVSKTNPKASITFHHLMAKLTFNFTSQTSDELQSARLDNAYCKGLANIMEGGVQADDSIGSIISKNVTTTGSSSKAEFLMIPNEAETTVTITYTYKNSGTYTAKVTIPTLSMGKSYTMTVKDETSVPTINNHEYVEIGGIKWATMNLGATTVAGSPSTCYGDYYAWGETEPRYTSINISDAGKVSFGGWISSHSNGYSENDNPTYTGTTLDADHDAATKNWGSSWRTPTNDDFKNLVKACTGSTSNQDISSISTSTPAGGIYWLSSDQTYLSEYSGVAGTLFVDKTDTSKRVFFPTAGYSFGTGFYNGGSDGDYWSSSLYTSYTTCAYCLIFSKSNVVPSYEGYGRYHGFTVRPVSD